MESVDKELEDQLMEAGNKLLNPPSSVDELLLLLDQVENCLSRVEQSPPDSMQSALAPSQMALIADQLFRHTDVDVKVAVASCISEITRITAPDAPYNDDQMKDVFQLILSSFENLADESSRSYHRRTMILETVAKVRSCVVMLDLECDALLIEMFQLLLNSIRNYHSENVFSSMETIMTLVLEESEDISVELLSPLLASVKRDNEEVLPIAQKLGEKVLKSCVTKVKPYLTEAVKLLGISIDEYSGVVASICQGDFGIDEQNDGHVADENNADGKMVEEGAPDEKVMSAIDDTLKPVVSNGVSQLDVDEKLVDSSSLKNLEDENHSEQKKHIDMSTNAEPQNLGAETVVEADGKPEYAAKKKGRKIIISKRRAEPVESTEIDDAKNEKLTDDKNNVQDVFSSPHQESSAEAYTENKETEAQLSSQKAVESGTRTVVSPSSSENLSDESPPKKARQSKKESLIKDSPPSGDDAPEESEEASDSDAKPPKHSGKKGSVVASTDYKALLHKDASKKEMGSSSNSEEPLEQLSNKVEASSINGDHSSLIQSKDKKCHSQVKAVSEKDVKSATRNDTEEKILSPKSSVKSPKDAHLVKETPKTDAKRKRVPGASKEYGEEVIGKKVKVWWPKDYQFYAGKIDSFDPEKKKHKIVYNDGDIEVLTLKREKFEFIGSNSESEEEKPASDGSAEKASDMQLKKVKTNFDRSKKQGKLDASQKQSIGTSKTNSASAKSGQKVNESGKTDGKSLDGSKASTASEDDVGTNGKKHNTKAGSKYTDASKSAHKTEGDLIRRKTGKSKEDGIGTLKASKSKQETPKSSKIKEDAPKSSHSSKGGKSNANAAKLKSASSKGIAEEDEENSTDSGEAPEITKGKSTSSSKGQGSQVKSGKKSSANDAKLKSDAFKGIAEEDENSSMDSGEAQEITKGKLTSSSSKGQRSQVKSGKKCSASNAKLKSGPAKGKAEEDGENWTDSGEAQESKKVKLSNSSKGHKSQVKSGKKGSASDAKLKSGPSKGKAEEDEENSTDSCVARETMKVKSTSSSRGQGSLVKSDKKGNANDGKLKSGPSKGTAEDENSAESGEAQETTKVKLTSSSKRQGIQVKVGKKRHRGA